MSTAKKIVIAIFCIFLAVIGSVYFIGAAFFQTHLKIGTVINGFHCSFKTADETEALLSREAGSYALAVMTRNGGVEKITAEDAGLTFTGRQKIIDIIDSQDSLLWFLPETEAVTLSNDLFQIDEEKAQNAIDGLKCMDHIVEGKTAKIVNTDGVYQVSPGIRGTNLDKELASEVIKTAITQWRDSVDLEQEGCYIDVREADENKLQEQCDFLNSIQDIVITYDFGDRKETVTMDTVESKLLDEDCMLTEDSVQGYVKALARKYNTVGDERNFLTFDDRAVLLSGGDYGWRMNIKKTAKSLVKLISDRTIDVVEPVYRQEAASRNANDIGYSYLEINASSGAVVLYVDGSPVVETWAEAGSGIAEGFWKVKDMQAITQDGQEDAIYFGDSYIYCDPAEGEVVPPSAIMVREQWAMEEIFARMEDNWPIIVYRMED